MESAISLGKYNVKKIIIDSAFISDWLRMMLEIFKPIKSQVKSLFFWPIIINVHSSFSQSERDQNKYMQLALSAGKCTCGITVDSTFASDWLRGSFNLDFLAHREVGTQLKAPPLKRLKARRSASHSK